MGAVEASPDQVALIAEASPVGVEHQLHAPFQHVAHRPGGSAHIGTSCTLMLGRLQQLHGEMRQPTAPGCRVADVAGLLLRPFDQVTDAGNALLCEAPMNRGCCRMNPIGAKSRGSSSGRLGATPGPPGSARNGEVAGM